MKQHVAFSSLALLLGIVLLGCEPPKPAANAQGGASASPTASAPPPSPAPLPSEARVGAFAGDINDLAAQPAAQPAQPAPAPPPTAPNTERVKAQAGVAAQGRSLDQHSGLIVTPVKAFFAGKERAFFDIEFPGNYRTWRV